MPEFTEAQLRAIAKLFGLTRVPDIVAVRDGYIKKGEKVWLCAVDGPELVDSEERWFWICHEPVLYQIKKPHTTVTYID